MSTSSIHKVFGTTELLEAILLELPCLDVFLVQRVARSWRATVLDSIALQRALFLAPVSAVSEKGATNFSQRVQLSWHGSNSPTAGQMLADLTSNPATLFANPLMSNLKRDEFGRFYVRLSNHQTGPPVFLARDNPFAPIIEHPWPLLRNQLLSPHVANMPLTSPPLREIPAVVDCILSQGGVRCRVGLGPNDDALSKITSADYVRVIDFVAWVERVVDLCLDANGKGSGSGSGVGKGVGVFRGCEIRLAGR